MLNSKSVTNVRILEVSDMLEKIVQLNELTQERGVNTARTEMVQTLIILCINKLKEEL